MEKEEYKKLIREMIDKAEDEVQVITSTKYIERRRRSNEQYY